jgi:hypothetical protein
MFNGCEISTNSKATTLTGHGVQVDAGVSSWAVTNSRIGNIASTLGNEQLNNINIASGASASFRIIGNNLGNPGAGGVPIANGSTLSSFIVSDNLPLQNVGTNTSTRLPLYGGSAAPVAAASTVYLGPSSASASVTSNPFAIHRAGTITGFYVATSGAATSGQSFTYTVLLNGVATSMTGTISGAVSFDVAVTSNAFLVATNDLVTLRLVTSGTAASVIHSFTLYFEQ